MSVPLGVASIAVGWILHGLDPLDVQCSREPYPAGRQYPLSVQIIDGPTLLPVGVACTYDADDIDPVTVDHFSFPATVGLLVSVLAFGGGGALVLVRD